MNKGPIISIITACFNAEKTIEQTIQSVLSQSYNNIEYIIVDGASTDGTMEIVEKYKDRINIIISEPDEGIYNAFNKGLKASNGTYVMYINSDDKLLSEDSIKFLVDGIFNFNYPVMIYGDIYLKNQISGFVKRINGSVTIEDLKKGKFPPHPATLIKKEVMLKFHGFNEKFKIAADTELIIKIMLAYPDSIVYIPKVITEFSTGGISTNSKNRELMNTENNEILCSYFQIKKQLVKNNDASFIKWIENLIFNNDIILDNVKKYNFNNIAIFGSGELSVLLSTQLNKYGVNVIAFLDNDLSQQGIRMNGIEITSPNWLLDNCEKIDGIISSVQGPHDEKIKEQIDSLNLSNNIKYISWKDILD